MAEGHLGTGGGKGRDLMDEYLWPARHVAEHAYCPRLFYYMEVEGIYLPSSDTVRGAATHKRVDRPSADAGGDPERPRSVRSLTLTSGSLGLTATLDLAEIDGHAAVPIEYRKGRPRHRTYAPSPEHDGESVPDVEPWPTDRVQVGLQAILLEEVGYTVPKAVLYYAAEKRRVELVVTEELRKEALATLEAAKNTASGGRPLPLLNDPRCPRCSLYPICLPDEVNAERQRAIAPKPQVKPPKVAFRGWPKHDDALHVVAQSEGVRIGVRGRTMRLSNGEGQTVRELPLVNVESLTVLGSVQLSTQAMTALAARNIPIAFCTTAGRLVAMVDPLDSVSADIRRAQVRAFDDPRKCLEVGRALVVSKIMNQRTMLMRNHGSLPDSVPEDLQAESMAGTESDRLESLRGHEGQAAAIYFRCFPGMIKPPDVAQEFHVNGRQRRPPPDPINCVLSFAYTMLTHECITALRLARLEPTIGAFHTSRPGRPALALDLMEPFRPLIAESIVISAVNRGEITPGHFTRTSAGCAMTSHGRAAFFSALSRRMDTEVTHPVFGYRLSYRRMLQLHAKMIAAWLLGEVPTLAFLTTR